MQVFWGRIFLVKGRSPIWGSQGTKSVEMQKVELGLYGQALYCHWEGREWQYKRLLTADAGKGV